MSKDSPGYTFPAAPAPGAIEWPGEPIGASNVVTRTKGRTKVHDKDLDREPGKLEKLLESVWRHRREHPDEQVWMHDVVIHGIRVRAETNSRHLYEFWVANWYSPEEWEAQTGTSPPGEPQVHVYAFGDVSREPEAAYYSHRASTIVFFNTAYYGQLKSWVLGAVGRVLASEYGIHSVHGACVEKAGKGVLYIAPTGTGKSLDGRARVLIEANGQRRLVPIGELVDEIMARPGWPLRRGGDGMEECLLAGEPFRVPALNNQFEIEWRPLRAILRHPAPARMIRVTTRSGRSVLATEDHSFLMLKDGRLTPVAGSELRAGDRLPVARRLPQTLRSVHAVGVHEPAPAQEALAHSGVCWDEIVSIEEERPSGDHVYDLSVEGCENFLTEGGLVVHNSTSSYGLMEFPGARFHSDDWVYIRYAFPTSSGEWLAPTRIRHPGGEVGGFRVFGWLEEHAAEQPAAQVEGLTLDQQTRRLRVEDLDLADGPRAYAYISEKVFYIRTNLVENFPEASPEFLRSDMENVPQVPSEFLEEHAPLLESLLTQVRDGPNPALVAYFDGKSDGEVKHLLARLFAFDNGRAMLNIGNVFPEEKVYLNPMEPVRLATVFLLRRDYATDRVLWKLSEGQFLGSLMVGRTPAGKFETAYNAYRAVLDEVERAFIQRLMDASGGDDEALYGLYGQAGDVPESLFQEFELFRMLYRSTDGHVLNTILMKDPEITERGQAVAYTMNLIARAVEEAVEEMVDLGNYKALAAAVSP